MNERICACVSVISSFCVSHGGLCCVLSSSSLNIPAAHEKDSPCLFSVTTSLLTHIATLSPPFTPDITPFAERGKDLNRSHFKARNGIYRAVMAVRGFGETCEMCCCRGETLRHFFKGDKRKKGGGGRLYVSLYQPGRERQSRKERQRGRERRGDTH